MTANHPPRMVSEDGSNSGDDSSSTGYSYEENQQQLPSKPNITTTTTTTNTTTQTTESSTNSSLLLWSGLETRGMRDAKCSLLLPEDITHDAKIKYLPKQRVLVYQDHGSGNNNSNGMNNNTGNNDTYSDPANNVQQENDDDQETTNKNTNTNNNNNNNENFYVDFQGATVLQLEPTILPPCQTKNNTQQQSVVMPITLTVGGRCVFTPENYQDFKVMMRTKVQSEEMGILPNGNFDWPDVDSLLLCPCCGHTGPVPRPGDKQEHEYWMIFFPLLQICTSVTTNQMTLGTRTICRLTCLDCMDDLLEGLTLQVVPGGGGGSSGNTLPHESNNNNRSLAFTLPAADVLAEAGSASFLDDNGPPRPQSHPHIDDILDAWTLYNLWEHSGTWEALQNDYRLTLSRSMQHSSNTNEPNKKNGPDQQQHQVALKSRIGRPCGNPDCNKVHGQPVVPVTTTPRGRKNKKNDPNDSYSTSSSSDEFDTDDDDDVNSGEAGNPATTTTTTTEICRLYIKCQECHSEYYCSKQCRQDSKSRHYGACLERQRERDERREKKAKKVECDTCARKFPYTKMKKCSSCRNATYCSVDCQRMDWQRHKYNCKR